jgi:alkanesulfonate monooxygenase SsuD/methylene tetrahydromethanopterin reductase-like flavin-dependent oxidoreductase (luciferase family)
MRIGVTAYFQNYPDWDRFNALEHGERVPALDPNTDASIWNEELESALQIEELGFDSIWTVEHHASPYTMITDPLQALSFFAGATSRVDVGTMVVVLPWHNPLRVAEQMVMLQHQLQGRDAFIGVGRGLGRREFKAMSVDMNESADRFTEAMEVIRLAITEERFSFEGKHYNYTDTTMRPRPRDAERLIDTMCFSWGSPSSAPRGAKFGLKPMIILQKAYEEYGDELEEFTKVLGEAGHPPARPRVHLHMYCHEDAAVAESRALKYIPEYVDSAMRNYELGGNHFGGVKGYEHYRDNVTTASEMSAAWVNNCVWGTPEMCLQKIQALSDTFHPEEFMLATRFGSMSADEARKSLELFAREVLPAAQEIPLQEPIGVSPSAV